MSTMEPPADQERGQRRRLRRRASWMLMAAVFTSALAFYVGSYYYLSRRGMAEAASYGMAGFLYVPASDVLATEDLSEHCYRCRIYAPLNWLDHNLLGGPSPVQGIIFRLQ